MWGANHGVRKVDDTEMICGQAVDGELGGDDAALGRRQHQLQVLVGAQGAGGLDDGREHDVLEGDGPVQVGGELHHELLGLAGAQGVVEHVLAAGIEPVDGGAGHAGLGGHVVDGDLGHAPALAATFDGIEDPILGRRLALRARPGDPHHE